MQILSRCMSVHSNCASNLHTLVWTIFFEFQSQNKLNAQKLISIDITDIGPSSIHTSIFHIFVVFGILVMVYSPHKSPALPKRSSHKPKTSNNGTKSSATINWCVVNKRGQHYLQWVVCYQNAWRKQKILHKYWIYECKKNRRVYEFFLQIDIIDAINCVCMHIAKVKLWNGRHRRGYGNEKQNDKGSERSRPKQYTHSHSMCLQIDF